MDIQALKKQSLDALNGNWGLAVGVFFVIALLMSLGSSIVSFIPFALFAIVGPFTAGLIIFCQNMLKGEALFEDGFKGFENFVKLAGGSFMVYLFTFLWTLLFIVPGVIKSYSYSMTLYILVDKPDTPVMDAITQSREMMDGNKMNLFILQLSFIGWMLLTLLTLGIGNLWLSPYMSMTTAGFYNQIKGDRVELV